MTTLLEHHIRDAFARQADRTILDPHAEFGSRSLRLDANEPRRDRPRRLVPTLVAAAAVALVGGLVVVSQMRDEQRGQATQPTSLDAPADDPTSFPVLDDAPPGMSAIATIQHVAEQPPWTEALVGRSVDGVLTDTVAITVQSHPFDISPMAGRSPTQAEVLGEPATVYDDGNLTGAGVVHVTWGAGPYFLASGASPLSFLDLATTGMFHAVAPDGTDEPTQLTFGQLPEGFDVIAPAQPVGQATVAATLSIGADNYDISVSTRNPVVYMSLVGPLRSIEVAGRPGWAFLSSFPTQDIAWQVDDSTFAYLKINDGTDGANSLALADNITFVDSDEWSTRYAPNTVAEPSATEPPAG